MLMSAKFLGTIGNFYKFYETLFDCEVAYQVWRLHHFLFKYKTGNKEFSVPMNLTEKQLS